jgi:hypothetical protein
MEQRDWRGPEAVYVKRLDQGYRGAGLLGKDSSRALLLL